MSETVYAKSSRVSVLDKGRSAPDAALEWPRWDGGDSAIVHVRRRSRPRSRSARITSELPPPARYQANLGITLGTQSDPIGSRFDVARRRTKDDRLLLPIIADSVVVSGLGTAAQVLLRLTWSARRSWIRPSIGPLRGSPFTCRPLRYLRD